MESSGITSDLVYFWIFWHSETPSDRCQLVILDCRLSLSQIRESTLNIIQSQTEKTSRNGSIPKFGAKNHTISNLFYENYGNPIVRWLADFYNIPSTSICAYNSQANQHSIRHKELKLMIIDQKRV